MAPKRNASTAPRSLEDLKTLIFAGADASSIGGKDHKALRKRCYSALGDHLEANDAEAAKVYKGIDDDIVRREWICAYSMDITTGNHIAKNSVEKVSENLNSWLKSGGQKMNSRGRVFSILRNTWRSIALVQKAARTLRVRL